MATELTYRHVMPVQIRFSDVDQYGHMNNSSYFSIYDLAKTSYMRDVFGDKNWRDLGIVVANINADFLAPVFFSDDLYIETTVIHLGHKSFTLLQRAINKASGVLKCQCRTVMVGYDMATKEPVELPDSFKKTERRWRNFRNRCKYKRKDAKAQRFYF